MTTNQDPSPTPAGARDRIKNPRRRQAAPALTPGPSPSGRGEAATPGPSPILPSTAGGRGEKPEKQIPSLLQIVVECQSEQEQQVLFEHLRKEGFPCRVLTL